VSDSIEKGICEIVADIAGVEPGDIRPETNFAQDLEIDSIKAIEITVAIEKKFKVSVRDEDVPKIMTLRQAVDLVTKLVEQKGLLHG
jgi:acyl carrier protein